MPRQRSLVTVIRDMVQEEVRSAIQSLLGSVSGTKPKAKNGRRRRRRRTRGTWRPCGPFAPPSLSAGDRDHQGATCHESYGDDGADRSSPSASCRRRFRVATGSRSRPPAAPCRGSRSRGFAVVASVLLAGLRFGRIRRATTLLMLAQITRLWLASTAHVDRE